MKFHEKIRTLREAKNWSQEEIAVKLNMSVSGYSKIECGESQLYISKLEQIAKALDVDLIELIPQNGSPIYMSNGNGNNCNIIGSLAELTFEIQKQKLINESQQKEIEMLKGKIEDLNRIIKLLENAK